MVDTNKIVSTNLFSGFKNYSSPPVFSTSVASQNITAGNSVGPIRASTALNNNKGISEVQIQYSGIESFYRLLPGFIGVDYPDNSAPSYQIESFSYYSGGSLIIDSYISNQTGGTITIPDITFNVRAFLYIAPFA